MFILNTQAQAYLYNETKTFYENGYTYQADKADYGIVTLYNKANQFTYAHYENKDGSPLKNIDLWGSLIEDDDWTRQKSMSIVNNIFSVAEKQRVKGAKIGVIMSVDPSTGKVIEVDFSLYYNTPDSTIPVSTFHNLELALKDQIWFTPTEEGKKLKFFKISWMHTVE